MALRNLFFDFTDFLGFKFFNFPILRKQFSLGIWNWGLISSEKMRLFGNFQPLYQKLWTQVLSSTSIYFKAFNVNLFYNRSNDLIFSVDSNHAMQNAFWQRLKKSCQERKLNHGWLLEEFTIIFTIYCSSTNHLIITFRKVSLERRR